MFYNNHYAMQNSLVFRYSHLNLIDIAFRYLDTISRFRGFVKHYLNLNAGFVSNMVYLYVTFNTMLHKIVKKTHAIRSLRLLFYKIENAKTSFVSDFISLIKASSYYPIIIS